MWRHQEHPSDETLLRSIDTELPVKRQMALDQHLKDCERCRSRLLEIESITDEATRVYRRDIGAQLVNAEALRARIQAEMASLGAAMDRSWWLRVRRATATLPLVTRAAVSLALVVLALQLVRPAQAIRSSWMTRAAPIAAEGLPIRSLTPGAAVNVSIETLCAGRPAVREPIPSSLRQAVLRQYRMEQVAEHEYELDYLITPELGGVADQRNLWPERYTAGVWNARVKDDLEELLPQLVCRGTLALTTAQHDIANDWIAAYKKYLRTDRPIDRDAHVRAGDDDLVGRRRRPSTVADQFSGAPRSQFVPVRVSLLASR